MILRFEIFIFIVNIFIPPFILFAKVQSDSLKTADTVIKASSVINDEKKERDSIPANQSGQADEVDSVKNEMKVSVKNEVYEASGIDERRPKRATLIELLGNFYNKSFNIKLDAHLSTEDMSAMQAVDQISLTAEYYDIGGLIFGDIIPKFNEYCLNGINLRGVDANLHASVFRLQFAGGIIKRAADSNETNLEGSYLRTMWTGNLSIGTEKSFIFNIGLLKIKDDTSSIAHPGNTKPEENLVASTSFSANIFDGMLKWSGEADVSAHTRNMYSEVYGGELNIIGTPLFTGRQSSRVSNAFNSKLELKLDRFSLTGNFKRIEPGYTSLGTVRHDNDYQEYGLESRYSLFKRLISARTTAAYRYDNLDNSKMATTELLRFIQTAFFNISKVFSFSVSYNLFHNSNNIISDDSVMTPLHSTTHNFSLTPMFVFGSPSFFNRLSLAGFYSVNTNADSGNYKLNYENLNLIISYGVSIGENFTTTLSNSHSRLVQTDNTQTINTSDIAIESLFYNRKLGVKLKGSFSYSEQFYFQQVIINDHWEAGMDINFRIAENEILSLQLHSTWHNPGRPGGFDEFRWWLNYSREIF